MVVKNKKSKVNKVIKKEAKIYSVISLFSGCGGLDLGFKGGFTSIGKKYSKHRFKIEWANDFDKNACLTYSKNFSEAVICADIKEIIDGSKSGVELPNSAHVVLGGFPCQDFSVAGKRLGFEGNRGKLYQSMVEVVKKTRPALFVAENVKGLLSMNNGQAIATIVNDFAKLGYDVTYKLYHAAEFGVPQNRERVIIVGTDQLRELPEFDFPKPILKRTKWVTLEKAIGDLKDKIEGEVANHFWSKAKMFEGTQGNIVVSPNSIGPTMRAEHHGNIEFHWSGQRRLSAREAARIQTFPDDFIFYPSTSSAYKQIGNAVPPVLGWHIAKSVKIFLDKFLQV